jgi:S-adenosylmethionine hydrolase
MRIVTLTTDLGYRDPYLATVKAKLITSQVPLQILDLSCEVKNNNISDAAYILQNAIQYFPPGTIHLVGVKFVINRSELNKAQHPDNSRYLICQYMEQYFLTPDTGLFTLLDEGFSAPVFQLYYEGTQHHFFLRDIFVNACLHLVKGGNLMDIATPAPDYYKAFQFKSYVTENILRGKGIYVDDFGNIITNITKSQWDTVIGSRQFTISLPGTRLTKIQNTYDDVRFGNPLVFFNSLGYLEVAVNGKSAYTMLCPRDIGSNFDFNLMVEFYD